MKFGKRQMMLCSLVFALGLAIYLNWQAATASLTVQEEVTETVTDAEEETTNYGDVQLVSTSTDSSTYFAEVRNDREVSRDEAVETIKSMFEDSDLDEEKIEVATASATTLATNIELETTIENLVKAKGFSDCVVFISDEQCNVVVQTSGLLASEAAQIKDIVVSNVDIEVENIRIVEVN